MADESDAEVALTAPFSHLEQKNHERLAHVLCIRIPEVFALIVLSSGEPDIRARSAKTCWWMCCPISVPWRLGMT